MSLGSQLGWMIRDHQQFRDGKIDWFQNLWRPVTAKQKPLLMGNKRPFAEIVDPDTGEIFKLFGGRAAKCKNPAIGVNLFLIIGDDKNPYRLIPAKNCKACHLADLARELGGE